MGEENPNGYAAAAKTMKKHTKTIHDAHDVLVAIHTLSLSFSAAMISRKNAKFHFFHVWLFFWDSISPSSPPWLLHPVVPVFCSAPPCQAARWEVEPGGE
jgi:hypothetical protein